MVQPRAAAVLAILGLLSATLLFAAAPASALRPLGPDVDALVLEVTDTSMAAVRAAGGDAGETTRAALGAARDAVFAVRDASAAAVDGAILDGANPLLEDAADGANMGLGTAMGGALLAADAAQGPVPGLLAGASLTGHFAQARLLSLEDLDRPILTSAPGVLDPLPVPTVDAAYGLIIDIGELLIGLEGYVDIRPGPLTQAVSGYAYDSGQTAAEWTDDAVADTVAFADALASNL